MGRPRKVDLDVLLQKAMGVFWRNGYATTTIADLERELGIGRKSLYNAFGDKRGLFIATLDRYLQAPIPVTLPDAGLAEIEQTFMRAPFLHPGFRACLMANTIVELGGSDADIASRTAAHVARLNAGFEGALRRATEAGDVVVTDPADTARFLTSSMQGLAVMARTGASQEDLLGVAAHTLRAIGR
jgi:TetR/AcrR family transcriptional regulator, transcriptional repressor for nem operon